MDKELLTVLYLEQVALKKKLLEEYLEEMKFATGGDVKK